VQVNVIARLDINKTLQIPNHCPKKIRPSGDYKFNKSIGLTLVPRSGMNGFITGTNEYRFDDCRDDMKKQSNSC